LGLSFDQAEAICRRSPRGDVLSGSPTRMIRRNFVWAARPPLKRADYLAKAAGAKRALLLPVSAAFHCALMAPRRRRNWRGALADVR